jgi:HEAT repeat protein
VRRLLAASLVCLAALTAAPARALVWPDVPDRIERDLGASDANTRRVAARELVQLGPARGAPLALRAMVDPDEEVRLAGADSAIRLRAAGGTEIAIPWLLSKEARERKKACEVARALPNPHTVAPLSRALGDQDADVRQAAAEALGYQGSPDAVSPLLAKLDDQTPSVRVQVIAALARIGDLRAVVPLVGKARDSATDVRQAVARALGDLGDPRASQALVAQLNDNVTDVKRDALAALGRLAVPDTVDAIAPFVTDRTPALREGAFFALGKIATPDAVRALVSALGQTDDAGGSLERTPVREALVLAGKAALPQLQALLEGQPSPQVATSAAWVLGEMKAQAMAPVLVAAMRRGVLPVASALQALAGAGTSDSVSVVLEFVGDPSSVVRAEALLAAAALLDPAHPDGRAVEPLSAALRDPRPAAQERAALATLLGETGAPRAAPVLADLVTAHDPALRLAAIDALGTLGPAGADDALTDQLSDADAQVRLHAAVALSQAGGEKARATITKKLDGEEEIDRTVLLTALGGILARAPDEAIVSRLVGELAITAGPERDALVVAFGRARVPAALRALVDLTKAPDADDRRVAASLLPAQGDAAAPAARALLSDSDASVRAEAAWALGSLGGAADVPALVALSRAPDVDPAADAAAAIGRIAARAKAPDLAARSLCPLVDGAAAHGAYVRANAFAGLALAGARCPAADVKVVAGAPERKALSSDYNDAVRTAAATAIERAPVAGAPDDARALERCAAQDRSGSVAHRCRLTSWTPAQKASDVEVYVIAEGTTAPHPRSPFALALADGTVHAGTADRRGAAFDPVAPDGAISLLRSSALAR